MNKALYLRDIEVAALFSVSRNTVWTWAKTGLLPKPLRISPGCTRWNRVETVSDFRVPMSPEAMRIIAGREKFGGEYLFSALRGKPISDVSLEKRLNDLGEAGRPHGFRTSFRTWVQDSDACSFEVAEAILAHSVGGKVERSYARSDILDRRRPVMAAWADYVTGAESSRVIAIR